MNSQGDEIAGVIAEGGGMQDVIDASLRTKVRAASPEDGIVLPELNDPLYARYEGGPPRQRLWPA